MIRHLIVLTASINVFANALNPAEDLFANSGLKVSFSLNSTATFLSVDGASVVAAGCADVPDVGGEVALPRIIFHIRYS